MPNTTICALATAPGGALGIIRISGPEAIAMADSIFRPLGSGKQPLSQRRPSSVAFGQIVNGQGEIIDEGLATVFRAPHSYTGEDSVELSLHGSPYILRTTLALLTANGCQMAAPGEYTQRAFLSGRMDLSQAEAVADLIASTSSRAHQVAMSQMRGATRNKLSELRSQLLRLTSLAELELDFADHEELEFAPRHQLLDLAQEVQHTIGHLMQTFAAGNAIRHGVAVAIVGQANAGKSTLLNALVGDERAIVSDIPGTTRDAIEDQIDIDGMTFRLIDTAGLRHTADHVEQIGIERTYDRISRADIIVWVVDATKANTQMAQLYHDITLRANGKPIIVAINKADIKSPLPTSPGGGGDWRRSDGALSPSPTGGGWEGAFREGAFREGASLEGASLEGAPTFIRISAKTGQGIDHLRQALVSATGIAHISPDDAIISSARHLAALTQAHEAIARAIDGLKTTLPTDLVCQDLRETISHLGDITGESITADETLRTIFSEFCVGK